MIEFRETSAEVIRLDLVLVKWVIRNTDEDESKIRYTVRKSYSPGGPFEAITGPLVSTFMFFDQARQQKSNWRKPYYSILATNVVTGDTVESPVASLAADPDLFLLEIRRRQNEIYLKRFVGIPASVFIAKTFARTVLGLSSRTKPIGSPSSFFIDFGRGIKPILAK